MTIDTEGLTLCVLVMCFFIMCLVLWELRLQRRMEAEDEQQDQRIKTLIRGEEKP